jgi:hypothetical protein
MAPTSCKGWTSVVFNIDGEFNPAELRKAAAVGAATKPIARKAALKADCIVSPLISGRRDATGTLLVDVGHVEICF